MRRVLQSLFNLSVLTVALCYKPDNHELVSKAVTTSEQASFTAVPAMSSEITISAVSTFVPNDTLTTTTEKMKLGKSSKTTSTQSSTRVTEAWKCPNISKMGVECSCDFPHTLRCTGDRTSLQIINQHLMHSQPGTISLLDVTATGISVLPPRFLKDIALHGLVISTGELRQVHENAFIALARSLQALGLPSNLLDSVPTAAFSHLVGLDRLDLSHNKLKTLEADAFRGLSNLTYLDLCDNLLSQLSPQAFSVLPSLRSLRMKGNQLSVSALSALRGLYNLEELDLSRNLLFGSMGPTLLPEMPSLQILTVSENGIANVRRGALTGLKNLSHLTLSHNQIDVLEDHSFIYLPTLTRLDLANNRIVAVSSASLAHLDKLISLDLTHNFLRSLTADLIVPLKSLQDLHLDDNDITMVSSELPTSTLHLKKLSLADNPFNCDCTLLEFANWLNKSSLNEEDKTSAVCATPPALENGILTQVSPGSLLCGEPTSSIMTKVPLPGSQLTLKDFHYDRLRGINLLWHVEPCIDHYTCDTLIIYETVGDSEVQIESSPLHCDSRNMQDPCSLPVAIPAPIHLLPGHKYRYCIVLLIPTDYNDVSLGLGCSNVITLEEKYEVQQTTVIYPTSIADAITSVHVNVSKGLLHVDIILSKIKPSSNACKLFIVVFDAKSAIHKRKLNCSLTFITVEVFLPGQYTVCASLDGLIDEDMIKSIENDHVKCVEVQVFKQYTELIVLAIIGGSCIFLIITVVIGCNLVRKVRHPRIPAQCILPDQDFEITHKAHYIKLLATTKV